MPYKTPELRRANYLANKELVKQQTAAWSKAHRESRRASYARWAKANPEKVKANRRAYYAANLEQQLAYSANWRAKHPEEVKEALLKYRKEHPEKYRSYVHKRRTVKTKAGGSYTVEEWKQTCRLAKFRCLCCKKKKPLTADHVIPVISGGTSFIENIQPLCRSCNSKKGTKTVDYRK
jgi:5-methylcytosine-specific restriction endonuclease McrA